MWGLAGFGQGELTLSPDTDNTQVYRPDIDMRMGAIGARGEVLSPAEPGGLAVAVKSDALWVRTSSDAVRGSTGNLEASEADVSRLRLLVEGSRTFETGGGALTPTLELGLRQEEASKSVGSK